MTLFSKDGYVRNKGGQGIEMLLSGLSVLLATFYLLFIAYGHKWVIHFAAKKHWPYEQGFIISSLLIGGISLGVIQIPLPFLIFNSFLKTAMSISVFMLVMAPILLVL